jgi:molybdopterin molybdotransferase
MPPNTPPPSAQSDVRMRGFAHRSTVAQALAWLDANSLPLGDEPVDLPAAAGRVLAREVVSRVDVPGFDRAMMDGYALHAADTLGASSYNRLALAIINPPANETGTPGTPEPPGTPGTSFDGTVEPGQAFRIMTGAPIPAGADGVLPVEQVDTQGDQVFAQGEVTPGKNIGQRGEDVAQGARVFDAGRQLRPQDLGVLSSIGVGKINVVRRPRVRLAVTGNELLPAGTTPDGFHIADANGPMLAALVTRDGGDVIDRGIVKDNPGDILEALNDDVDVVLLSGGSSVGQDDHAPVLLAQHGELAIHGIAMRPSSPAGMGRIGQRRVFLLPGNPVSCLCAYDFFAGRAIRALGGRSRDWPYATVTRPLRRKLVSQVGRVDYARVTLIDDAVEPLAIGGASVLSSTTRAHGFVVIDADSEGFAADSPVHVYLYDSWGCV